MAQPAIQTSFHAGEWAPALNARVDLAKYHAAAALLRNFFVDYRGGASTRAGTKYIIQAYKSDTAVRLIPFQASFEVSYVLEFGDNYIRFIADGAAVLETGFAISATPFLNPLIITVVGHNFAVDDWIFITGVNGMTELNGKYFRVQAVGGNNVTLGDLQGVDIDATSFTPYTSGGLAQRVYTIASPYAAEELNLLKFAQNVDTMVICHPMHPPYLLTLFSATNWTLAQITFGTTVAMATGLGAVTTGAGILNVSYSITAVNKDGQESLSTTPVDITINPAAGTNATVTLSWTASSGAVGYNIYRSIVSIAGVIPTGAAFGFVSHVTGVSFVDTFYSGVPQLPTDYSVNLPIPQNPFLGSGLAIINVTNAGTYTTVPTVTIGPPATGGVQATAGVTLGLSAPFAVSSSLGSMSIGDIVIPWESGGSGPIPGGYGGIQIRCTALDGLGQFANGEIVSTGGISSGSTPANPVQFRRNLGSGQPGFTSRTNLNLVWGVVAVPIFVAGAGYTTIPTVTFSAGAATATAVLGPGSSGNPTVPIFFQQRLVLAGPTGSPQQFNMSQPGSYFNFNTSNPIQPDDAISGVLVSGQLNTIKAFVGMPPGLVTLSDRQAWLIAGSQGLAVTPIDIAANQHSYSGMTDVPPIVANFDILFVQSKGSIVRDLAFNFYSNVFTGTDVSVLSSHLFYGHTISEWAYAEEPFKVVWAVRDDGVLLSLTFLKEQELIGWAHSDTSAGFFRSVAAITEQVQFGSVDALYCVVERILPDGSGHIKYIERMAERIFPNGATDAWCVDSGIQYNGPPATTFSGGEHLAGYFVTGLADGIVIPGFIMPEDGTFTLTTPASKVTVGLGYTAQLQTLALDLGEPTVQGKRKKITAVTLRCENTLGLSIGSTFNNLVPMKDLVVGNIGTMTNAVVTNLVTGDARTLTDPTWTVPGQYCIQQVAPFPATILGVIPEIAVGDTK